MKKGLVAIGALAIAVLGFFLFRAPEGASDGETPSSANEREAANDSTSRRPVPPRRMAGESSDPAAPQRYAGSSGDADAPTRRFVRNDGTEVRDHRSSAPEPSLDRRPTLPRALSKVQPETLRAVRLALRPQMMKCIEANVPDAEENSKAQAVLTVSIKGEQLTVDELDFQTTGVTPESEVKLRDCVTEVMVGHQQTISGSPDVDKHVMTFPYDL